MNPANEAYRIQQRDRQETERLKLYRPGWDDVQSFLADKKYVQSLWDNWMHGWCESWVDAAEQADVVKEKLQSDKVWAEVVFKTWGWTVEQYDAWVREENRKQKEQ